MAFKLEDLIKETTSTTGTAHLTLGGAVSGYLAFSSYLDNNDTTVYCLIGSDGSKEIGVGTFVSPSTLQRTTVRSSTTGSKISLPTGTHTVFCGPDADTVELAYTALQPDTALIITDEVRETPTVTNPTGASVTIDITNGTLFDLTLGANLDSLTLPTATSGRQFTLAIVAGSYTITWPAAVIWANAASAPVPSTAGKADVFTFVALRSKWLAFIGGQGYVV